ncbi:MAG: DegV family protein [Ruminococcaceae bacterium]|nr:DegV family protein [Oscillospiraceae bacterium]
MRIKITADSTCDIGEALAKKYDVEIIPLYVVMDDKPFMDLIEINPQQIFDHVASTGKICHTSAVNAALYGEIFAKYAKDYDAVIHVNLSSSLSACHQNAKIAAEEFDNVYVVDSLNLSTGSGHIVLDAAIMAREGKSAEEIVKFLEDAVKKVEASFVLDTLLYLQKGGRCSSIVALGANLLKLKPCIEVIDGKMQVGKKYRGTLNKCVEMYIADRLTGRDDIDYRRIFITHTAETNPELVKCAEEAVKKYGSFEEVLITSAGCTIANHCGPNCLGILFYRK